MAGMDSPLAIDWNPMEGHQDTHPFQRRVPLSGRSTRSTAALERAVNEQEQARLGAEALQTTPDEGLLAWGGDDHAQRRGALVLPSFDEGSSPRARSPARARGKAPKAKVSRASAANEVDTVYVVPVR